MFVYKNICFHLEGITELIPVSPLLRTHVDPRHRTITFLSFRFCILTSLRWNNYSEGECINNERKDAAQ
ncbi:hypothetical protein V1477_013206 [Vespula maculifrons]|uniref:Uncharacterized protein n=2 Tax=Vespula TaxID=7451 RepID=A0A834U7K8_VESPE|nr:hypothetical protein H0235_010319 [Vespula pensylvanica]